MLPGERRFIKKCISCSRFPLKNKRWEFKEIKQYRLINRRRAKDHEKLAKFAASLYKTVKALTALSPLYVFSAEAFTDIYLEAEDYRSSVLSEDKREQDKAIEKR